MSEKKSDNAVVRFFRGVGKFFAAIPRRFNEVRHELKKVIWPTKEKMIQLSAVVLVVILAAAVFLTFIEKGTNFVLKQVGFYEQVSESTAASVLPSDSVAEVTVATTSAETTAATSAADTTAAS